VCEKVYFDVGDGRSLQHCLKELKILCLNTTTFLKVGLSFYETTWRQVPQDRHLRACGRENPKIQLACSLIFFYVTFDTRVCITFEDELNMAHSLIAVRTEECTLKYKEPEQLEDTKKLKPHY
jgi:hypothetical protein